MQGVWEGGRLYLYVYSRVFLLLSGRNEMIPLSLSAIWPGARSWEDEHVLKQRPSLNRMF